MGDEVSKTERARDNKDRIGAAIEDSVNFHVHSLTHSKHQGYVKLLTLLP